MSDLSLLYKMTSIKWTKLHDWSSWQQFDVGHKKSLEEWVTQQDIDSIDYQPEHPRSDGRKAMWSRLRPMYYNLVIVHRRPGGRLDRHLLSMEYSTRRIRKGEIFPDLPSLLLYPVGVLHKPRVIVPEDPSFTLRTMDSYDWTVNRNIEWYKDDYKFITWNDCRYSVHTYPYTTELLDGDYDDMATKGDTASYYGLKIRQIPAITPLAEIYVRRWRKLPSSILELVLMFLKKPGRDGPIRFRIEL